MSETDSALFNVDINNYNGPLDVLLTLHFGWSINTNNIHTRFYYIRNNF